jgi:hypothetical protein
MKLETISNDMDKFEKILKKIKFKGSEPYTETIYTVLDWLYDMFYVKKWERMRLQPDNWKILKPFVFPKTIALLTKEKYSQEVLYDELSKFLNKITEIGHMTMGDFDLLQFNLARILGKNADNVVEHVRGKLLVKLKNLEEKKTMEEESEKRVIEEERQRISNMSAQELKKYVVSGMFDFSQSARTLTERGIALKKNRKSVVSQKEKFRNFAIRLHDAIAIARGMSQTHVRLRSDVVRDRSIIVGKKFREKATEFVSEEGFQKKVTKAAAMINKASTKVSSQMTLVRYAFQEKAEKLVSEEGFKGMVDNAKKVMYRKRNELRLQEDTKRKDITHQGKMELGQAAKTMLEGKDKFSVDIQGARGLIQYVGERETYQAKETILMGKEDFLSDVKRARGYFYDKENVFVAAKGTLTKGKMDFLEKTGKVSEKFLARGTELHEDMFSSINSQKIVFTKERDTAREKFLKRAEEIKGKGTVKMGSMRTGMQRFAVGKEQFARKGEELKNRDISAPKRKGYYEKGYIITDKGKAVKNKMVEKIKEDRDLFQLDVRFAKDRLKKAAAIFKEKVETKNEEFKMKQETVSARFKARQKAHLMQSLLRTIRTMR